MRLLTPTARSRGSLLRCSLLNDPPGYCEPVRIVAEFGVTVMVTGMLNGVGRPGVPVAPPAPVPVPVVPELIVIVPVYVPGVSELGSISTARLSGVVPLFGATNNQALLPELVDVARNGSDVV
jgi:hypothetical protein